MKKKKKTLHWKPYILAFYTEKRVYKDSLECKMMARENLDDEKHLRKYVTSCIQLLHLKLEREKVDREGERLKKLHRKHFR